MKMFSLIILSLLFFLNGCGLFGNDSTDFFTITPVSAVEVALEIHAAKGDQITIQRNGTEIYTFRMSASDTVLIDGGLTPATSYIWKADNHARGGRWRPAEVQATTLDNTSHTFTWQKFQFGEYSSSFIRDVAIIDENNIWAVGDIYLNDSTGMEDTTPYNAVYWNGEEWSEMRVPFDACGGVTYPPIRSVFALSQDDIWFARGGSVTHYDGEGYTNDCSMNEFLTGSINKIWGRSSEDIFIAGNSGDLFNYNGENWQKLETGTTLNINDIWGSQHPQTGEWEILAVASVAFESNQNAVLKIRSQEISSLSTTGLGPGIDTIWFEEKGKYFIGGNDLYETVNPDMGWTLPTEFQPGFLGSKAAVRGSSLINIVVVGTYGLVMHFNGKNWTLYEDQLLLPSGAYTSVDVTEDIVVAGGAHGGKGIVLMGWRE